MIQFSCTGCGQRVSVGNELAGKRTKCMACKTSCAVPGTPMAELASAAEPEIIAYRTPRPKPQRTDEYGGLLIVSVILRVNALVSYTFALLLFLVSMTIACNAISKSDWPAALIGAYTMIPALGCFVEGAFSHGASAACLALRDIAMKVNRMAENHYDL